jgi:hypothetical protein
MMTHDEEQTRRQIEARLAEGPSSPQWDAERFDEVRDELSLLERQLVAYAKAAQAYTAKFAAAQAANDRARMQKLARKGPPKVKAPDGQVFQDLTGELLLLSIDRSADVLRTERDPVGAVLLAGFRDCQTAADAGDQDARQRMGQLNEEWEALRDELRRRAYDEKHPGH